MKMNAKKRKWFVIGSVLLNVLLGGVIIGHAYHHAQWKGRIHGKFEEEALAALPEAKQERFHIVMKQARDDNHALHRQMRDARKRTFKTLSAEMFDEAKYLQHFAEVGALKAQMMQRFAAGVTELAREFSPEERKVLATMFRHPPKRFRCHEPPAGEGDGPPSPPPGE